MKLTSAITSPPPRTSTPTTPAPASPIGNNFTLAKTLTGHSSLVSSVTFSPDGRTLASGSGNILDLKSDNSIKLWDVGSGKLLKTLTGHSSVVWSVAFSPDGRTLASGSSDNSIKLWQLSGR